MARPKSEFLTENERKIMELLWHQGPLSIKDITQLLNEKNTEGKTNAYTTVLTMCRILTKKDYVTYDKKGRAFIYKALVSETEVKKTVIKSLLQHFFAGSSASLAQHLITSDEINIDDLDDLQKQIDLKRKSQK
ncbi:MAG: BlaI/MecI/CopY family transcriptional regulator [Saccharospirillaceae bacterium]|nr:BlaI/MecI/CopY family transcriptional regulator [Pseudomonadales bacterium]NRB79338.1 BlaI/MecI/CopY family transcriptional regulator [Saccharospirillaceae bacterium]